MGASGCQPKDLKGNRPSKRRNFIQHQLKRFVNLLIPKIEYAYLKRYNINREEFKKALFEIAKNIDDFLLHKNEGREKFLIIQRALVERYRLYIGLMLCHYQNANISEVEKILTWLIKDLERLRKKEEFEIVKINGQEMIDLR